MNSLARSIATTRPVVSVALALLVLACALPAAGQGLVEYSVELMPLPNGYHASTARGIADGDWDRPIIVGTVENSPSMAACWIPEPQGWTAYVLPGLDPNMDSRANSVAVAPPGLGDWVLPVGMSMDAAGKKVPATWNIRPSMPVDINPLPVLNAGTGEANAAFRPEGAPVRALVCGYADETPPMAAGDAPLLQLSVPMIWEVTQTGERIFRPEFGVGLAGHANDIGSAGIDGFVAVGGGQSATGGWMPQMWASGDDGETWQNQAMPLPVNMVTAEATGLDYDGQGTLLVAGWSQDAAGMTFPIVWERATGNPTAPWIIHELPLPAGADGGQGGSVRKKPGRVKYSSLTFSQGVAEMTLWINDGNGWTALAPADYLMDPQIGVPIAPGALNGKFDAVATEMGTASEGGGFAPMQMDTIAAVLVSTSLTGVEHKTPTPIAVSAAPNPFNPGVRIGYTLPRAARVSVAIYDATGALVTRFEPGLVAGGQEHAVFWNGNLRNGDRAASGVYFVRVSTPFALSTVKVVKVE